MKSSEILRSISKSARRFFILKKLGLDELNRCAAAASLMEIYQSGGTILVQNLTSQFRRDKPDMVTLGLITEQQTNQIGDNYKKLLSVTLTEKGQRWAKTADEKLQKSYAKIPA
jgi:hypothetical protein